MLEQFLKRCCVRDDVAVEEDRREWFPVRHGAGRSEERAYRGSGRFECGIVFLNMELCDYMIIHDQFDQLQEKSIGRPSAATLTAMSSRGSAINRARTALPCNLGVETFVIVIVSRQNREFGYAGGL